MATMLVLLKTTKIWGHDVHRNVPENSPVIVYNTDASNLIRSR
jgi:hypothetical protein